jgi:glycosyltransferase involved in cell wall biosynthesis
MFLDNVTMYACLTEFQRDLLIRNGFPAERIVVVPNMVDSNGVQVSQEQGEYVGYVGRVSPEKGLPTLTEAAKDCSNIQFKVAGSYDRMPHIVTTAPPNVECLGHIRQPDLDCFYAGCRILVLTSLCYETFGLSLAEAGIRGKPVICSRIGGLPEIVDDGVTGLLFEPGNADDLGEKIHYLWDRPQLCRRMGQAAREKALREYSPEKYYERLIAVYEETINICKKTNKRNFA